MDCQVYLAAGPNLLLQSGKKVFTLSSQAKITPIYASSSKIEAITIDNNYQRLKILTNDSNTMEMIY